MIIFKFKLNYFTLKVRVWSIYFLLALFLSIHMLQSYNRVESYTSTAVICDFPLNRTHPPLWLDRGLYGGGVRSILFSPLGAKLDSDVLRRFFRIKFAPLSGVTHWNRTIQGDMEGKIEEIHPSQIYSYTIFFQSWFPVMRSVIIRKSKSYLHNAAIKATAVKSRWPPAPPRLLEKRLKEGRIEVFSISQGWNDKWVEFFSLFALFFCEYYIWICQRNSDSTTDWRICEAINLRKSNC